MKSVKKETLLILLALFFLSAIFVSGFSHYINKVSDSILENSQNASIVKSFFLKGIIWLFLTSTTFGSCLLFYKLIMKASALPRFLHAKVSWKHFAILFLFFFMIAFIRYRFIGIPDFLEYGDQVYYWTNIDFGQNGHFSMADYINKIHVTFRGVYCIVPSNIAFTLGKWFHVDPLYFYFLITTFLSAALVSYIIPKLYQLLSNHDCELWHLLLFVVLVLIFWNWMLVNVLMDVFGITFYLAGLVFILSFSREKKLFQLVLGSVFFYLSTSFRLAYQYGVYGFLIAFAIKYIITVSKAIKANEFRAKYANVKYMMRSAICILLVVLSVLVVSYPQILFNKANGHSGITCYDSNDSVIAGYSLAETSANISISSTFVLSPIGFLPDAQIQSIKLSKYALADNLQMSQLLELFMSNPLDTMILVGKKLFEGFNVQLNAIYLWSAANELAPLWSRHLLSYINYVVIFCCIYSLFKAKFTNMEIIFLAINFITLIAPQLFLHIEWRYFIIGYIGIYYCFIFKFIPLLVQNRNEASASRFLIRLSGYVYLCFWISRSMHR